MKADNQLHVFSTFMGIPPDSDTPPVCGKKLTSAYSGKGKPKCPKCERLWKPGRRLTVRCPLCGKAKSRERTICRWCYAKWLKLNAGECR
jgi:predicted amidophosphoribosyltransferase